MSISVKLNKKGIKKLQKELEQEMKKRTIVGESVQYWKKEKKMGVILSLVHWTYLMKFQTLNLMLEI